MVSFEALIFTLAALGISETVYLIKKRLLTQMPVCLIGEGCAKVLTSRYSTLFLIPNDVLGLLFYIAASLVAAFLVIGVQPTSFWLKLLMVMTLLGSLLSLFFTYLQAQVIKAWCFWCLMSACTIWLMTGIILVSNLR